MLCEYKDVFGKPKEGLHKYRLFGIAIVDLVLTLLGAYVLHRVFHWNLWVVIGSLLLLGIVAHRLFCVRTTVDRWLFPNADK